MAKQLTKTQTKRAYEAILSKATNLLIRTQATNVPFGTQDYITIEKICKKYLKKL